VTPYVITPLAEGDLEGIWQYIARENRTAADHLLAKFQDKFLMLANRPLLGERREDLRPNLRAFTVGRYVIYYRPTADELEIIRVLHSARDVRALL
jgi:toxin ParE1/3/4